MTKKTASIQPAKPTSNFTALEWLAYIEALHPKAISMGLDRVAEVAKRLHLNPTFPIITVAGTNGKGSTCAMLAAVYTQAGLKVGCYTSPHLIRYNERVKVHNLAITDADLCIAFNAVEAARANIEQGEISLTYFEIGTLAAMWHFCHVGCDVVILEVGLGGRLDAVNIFEPTCAIVTAVDLDHMEFLGDTREKIGFEKAGIFRRAKLAICGDENPPQSLTNFAAIIGANLAIINRDFSVQKNADGWQYSAQNLTLQLPKLALNGDFQMNNAACVVCTVLALQEILPASQANIHAAFKAVKLMGRFYCLQTTPTIIVDVAHNPQAALSLAHNLKLAQCEGRTLAVFAMLRDKDIDGVVQALLPHIDEWFLADIHHVRGAKAIVLQAVLLKNNPQTKLHMFTDVASAVISACKTAHKNDRIIVFGSFYTVADAILSVK